MQQAVPDEPVGHDGEEEGGFFDYLGAFFINFEEWFAADVILLPSLFALNGVRAEILGNTPNVEVLFGLIDFLGLGTLYYDMLNNRMGLGPQVLGINSQVDVTINHSTPTWSILNFTLFRDGLGILQALGLESDPDYVNPGFPWFFLPREWQEFFRGAALFEFDVYGGSIIEALGEVGAMLQQLWTITVATSI